MIKLLRKEIQLAASPLSYFFIGFSLMAFVPGYPILVGSFFVCLGLFQSFQTAREANDLTYTALLPVAKRDVVRAKYAFCCFIEICYFTLTGAVTLIRMTLLSNAAVYRNNVLMNANLVYLAFVLLILGLFNAIFVGGFFSDCLQICQTLCKIYYCRLCGRGAGRNALSHPGARCVERVWFCAYGVAVGHPCTGDPSVFRIDGVIQTPGNAKF